MLWLALISLFLVTAAMFLPWLRGARLPIPQRGDYDLAVYRSQLEEITRDIEQNLLSPDQAEAARTEIHRRMLAAEDFGAGIATPSPSTPAKKHVWMAVGTMLLVGLCSFSLYAKLGSPTLPDQPFRERHAKDPTFIMLSRAQALEASLEKTPDIKGYQKLANVYFLARNYNQAATTYRKAINLGAKDANTWASFGESLVMANDGAVMGEAMHAFTEALLIDKKDARSRFYVGLAHAQIGRQEKAVAIWRDLEKGAPSDASWLPMVQEYIAVFAKKGGFDPLSLAPRAPSLPAQNTIHP